MANFLSPVGGAGAQFFDNNGYPLAGGKLYTYVAGTTTPQATYTTDAGTVNHTNPIVLDSAGRVSSGEIWLTDSTAYKLVLKTSADVLIATYDSITGINSNNPTIPVTPDATETTAGIVELATVVEAQTGTDTTRAVTPAGLASAISSIPTAALGSGTASSTTFLRGDSTWSPLGTGTPDSTTFLRGDGTWAPVSDADTLDGQHASAFALASHTHTGYVPNNGSTMIGMYTGFMGVDTSYVVGSNYVNVPINSTGYVAGGTWKCLHHTWATSTSDPNLNYYLDILQRIA